MSSLGKRLAVVLVPLALAVPVVLTTPDVAHGATAQQCRRTLPSYPELEYGDRRPAVRTLQCAINDLGLGPVVVDGYYGPETKAALRPVVGSFEGQPPHPYRITKTFWTMLYGAQLPDHELREGDHGPAVRTLQLALRAWGLEIVVDGDFGPRTREAVETFQKAHAMVPIGRVNYATRYMLGGGEYY
jgi:peptidoglycan hydrolase-like protein with peptidoglycan-binding domain